MKNIFFDKMVLGLHFDGSNGGSTFTDVVSGNSWSASGAALSTAQARFGATSGIFSGSGYVSGSAPGMSQSGGVWSFACFIYISALPSTTVMIFDSRNASGANGLAVYLAQSSGCLCCQVASPSNGSYTLVSSTAAALNAWNFVTASCFDGVMSLALSGVRVASVSNGSGWAFTNTTGIQIGRSYAGANYFTGYIDDLVFYRGVAPYSLLSFPVPGDPFGDVQGLDGSQIANLSVRTGPTSPAVSVRSEAAGYRSLDLYYGGRGVVTGTVKTKGSPANIPVVRRVRLYRDVDGVLVGETWSNADGVYAFDRLDPLQTYTAISYDHTGLFESTCGSKLPAKVAA